MITAKATFKRMKATAIMSRVNIVSADLAQVLLDLDSLNGETIGTTADDKITFAEGWRDDVKDSIAAYGVSMTGAKPADYDSKVALIGAAVTAPIKTALDAANEEASVDLTAGIALVDTNYAEISAAITAAGVSMTGVKPSGYDAKITEAIYATAFSFDVANKAIAHYDHASFGNRPVIPGVIRGHTVGRIGLSRDGDSWPGFRNMPLLSVTFPNQPLVLDLVTFYNCGLKTISLPDGCVVQNVTFGANPIAFAKLGSSVDIYGNGSISSYGALKTLYDGLGKPAGYYAYAAGAWATITNTTESFSVENGTLSRSELLQILSLLPTVSGKTITATGCTGAADLTAGDIAAFAAKGWAIVL